MSMFFYSFVVVLIFFEHSLGLFFSSSLCFFSTRFDLLASSKQTNKQQTQQLKYFLSWSHVCEFFRLFACFSQPLQPSQTHYFAKNSGLFVTMVVAAWNYILPICFIGVKKWKKDGREREKLRDKDKLKPTSAEQTDFF